MITTNKQFAYSIQGLINGPYELKGLEERIKNYALTCQPNAILHTLKVDFKYGGYYESGEVFIIGERPETTKEKEIREKQAKQAKERRKKKQLDKMEAERKKYERLKKKFGEK